jgi:hypothetical protein
LFNADLPGDKVTAQRLYHGQEDMDMHRENDEVLRYNIFTILIVASSLPRLFAYDNGLGCTPPMGWNSWNHFHCDIAEQLIRDTPQAMLLTLV